MAKCAEGNPLDPPWEQEGTVNMSLGVERFVATEVKEKDMICGIELAPCKSEAGSHSTESTAPLISDKSSSWSLSDTSIVEVKANSSREQELEESESAEELAFYYEQHGDIENYSHGNCSPIYGRVVEKQRTSPLIDHRNVYQVPEESVTFETILVLKPKSAARENLSPKLPVIEYSDEDKKSDSSTVSEVGQPATSVVYPKPDRLLRSLTSRTYRMLCQLSLTASDVPFLFNRIDQSANAKVHTPFMMFPEQTSVIVARGKDVDTYQLSSRGPMHCGALTNLFRLRGDISGRQIGVQSFAYCDMVPALVRQSPLSLDASTFRVQLSKWLENNRTKFDKKRQAMQLVAREQKPKLSSENQIELSPSVLPLIANSEWENKYKAVKDEELRAVMEITKDGEDVSTLFPSFSLDSLDFSESDDGLSSEIGALAEIEHDLRKELETADIIIKGISPSGKRFISKRTTRNDQFPDASESSSEEFPFPLDDTRFLKLARDLPARRVGKDPRRVRFSGENEEFVYVSDTTFSTSEDSTESTSLLVRLEEAYRVVEDLMEGMGLSCASAMEPSSPDAEKNVATESSKLYFF